MGPMALPPPSRKRRWGWFVVLALFAFTGGIAAGPTLTEGASSIVEGADAMLRRHAPKFLINLLPAPPASASAVAPAPRLVAVPAPPRPRQPRIDEPGKPVEAAAPRAPVAVPSRAAAAPEPAEVAEAEAPAARSGHAKGAVKSASLPAAPARKPGKYQDPFDTGGAGSGDAPTASPSRGKPVADARPAPAKSESAPRPAAKSSDPLDNLIADAVTETKGKGKKHESKGIDAMLKDVQKGDATPAPKREAAAELPPLSSADISKAMAAVKTKGNDCAHRLGGSGVAELKLTVGKDGKVTDVRVGGKVGNTPLGDCVEKAARAAKFPPNAGLHFDYKMDVR